MLQTKLNKILTVITAVTFAAALTLNIQASLNDPFAGMSDEAVALTSTDEETTGSTADCWELLERGGTISEIICEIETNGNTWYCVYVLDVKRVGSLTTCAIIQ